MLSYKKQKMGALGRHNSYERAPCLGVPTVHTTKSGKQLPATRCISPGSDKPFPKTFGAREQARAARFQEKNK